MGERKKVDGVLANNYTWYTNKECFDRAEKIGSGLLNGDFLETTSEYRNIPMKFVGIYSKNTFNFLLTEIACTIYGITIVPIYDTLGEESTIFAFKQTKMKTCFVSQHHVEKLI